jgi:hypothetical protein
VKFVALLTVIESDCAWMYSYIQTFDQPLLILVAALLRALSVLTQKTGLHPSSKFTANGIELLVLGQSAKCFTRFRFI